jgi:hypothetical protein
MKNSRRPNKISKTSLSLQVPKFKAKIFNSVQSQRRKCRTGKRKLRNIKNPNENKKCKQTKMS